MSECTNNDRLGIIGCGASYGGERQHSVARVTWSEHPDGRAHITGALSTIEKCWQGERMVHPSERGFVELRPGYWGSDPGDGGHWARSESQDCRDGDARSDETGSGGTAVSPEPEIGATGLLSGEAS